MRDDFTKRTIDTLADRAGNRCSNPNCRKPTSGPRTDPTKAISVGVAAHITAASEDGPRYDPSLSSEQRKHPDNGLWLCQNCAKLIDNDPARYPVGLLREWKEQAEQAALQDIEHGFVQRIAHIFAGDTEAQRALCNRQAMLKLVHNTWIKGVLEQSLHGAAMIELGMEERADAVQRPWDVIVQMPDQLNRQLPHGTRIIDVFDEMNHSLLILGEPGAGKTTMLLELARDTIDRAEQDLARPIPVVFNLSSWAEKKGSFSEWLIRELRAKYNVASQDGRAWLNNNELLLLLDGLDEVKAELRNDCVMALNSFRKHASQMVVCSRIADYEALTARLNLCGAVLLQPLTSEQIHEYLDEAGSRLLPVRSALEQDRTLRQLARTPVMLSIMVLAFCGSPARNVASNHSLEAPRQQLFSVYVERMFKRRGAMQLYRPDQATHWLCWLAQKMSADARSVFLIEELQPDWLDTQSQRWGYLVAFTLIVGQMGALVGGLTGALVGGLMGALIGWYGDRYLLLFPMHGDKADLEANIKAGKVTSGTLHLDLKYGVKLLPFGLGLELLVLFLRADKVLDFGLGKALGISLVAALVFWLWAGLEIRTRPEPTIVSNQGTFQSARNGIAFGFGIGLWGLVVVLLSEWIDKGLGAGLISGLKVGLLFGWVYSLLYGGFTVVRHVVVRLLLTLSGYMPLRYARFLDYATERIFLRKVGGGYIFVHRLLQEYFASLWTEETQS